MGKKPWKKVQNLLAGILTSYPKRGGFIQKESPIRPGKDKAVI